MSEQRNWKSRVSNLFASFVMGGAFLEAAFEVVRGGFSGGRKPTVPEPTPQRPLTDLAIPSAVPLDLHPGWSFPRPSKLPKPTYNPVILAAGIIFLALGIVSSYYVSGVGAILFIVGLGKWIGELQNEH